MRRAYKCRAYPDPEQAVQLSRTFGCLRLVWNRTLAERTRVWREEGKRTSYRDTDAALTRWKKTPELAFLGQVSSVPLQQTLRHQHAAFVGFFAGRTRYPRFKARGGRQAAHYTRSAFRLRDGRLRLAKSISPLRFVWSWSQDSLTELDPTMVIVSREADGRWYVTFSVETDAPVPAPAPAPAPEAGSGTQTAAEEGDVVGIDLGVMDLATLSTGEKIPNPRHLARKARGLVRYQRRMARTQRGSKNRRKARRRVAASHRKVRHLRQDFLHKLTTRLVREHPIIAIEDLNVRGMTASAKGTHGQPGRKVQAKAGLNRAVLDASFGEIRRQLEYKTQRAGRLLVVVDRWLASSKTCSECHYVLAELSLRTRVWSCPGCRTRHDREVNAARNISAAGRVAVRGSTLDDACGAGVRRQGSSLSQPAKKQETGPVRVTTMAVPGR
ncbi:transposase [Nocardiopsis sp. HUAS JQ3]|uniref:RNA-guided endonuclease InsQ/TnpB family protein n=1 Tax=Nocardiopsis sp. HUAS JQ3 TaxID=3061629 RepID=UPI0023A9E7C6|nr:transposase [Nocardiopsis sp. HUAS JQ3]WDZ93453.1 transposase [Nocardiopsis sp. HUAS JQ3]